MTPGDAQGQQRSEDSCLRAARANVSSVRGGRAHHSSGRLTGGTAHVCEHATKSECKPLCVPIEASLSPRAAQRDTAEGACSTRCCCCGAARGSVRGVVITTTAVLLLLFCFWSCVLHSAADIPTALAFTHNSAAQPSLPDDLFDGMRPRRSSAARLTSRQGPDSMQGCCLVGAGVAKAFIPTKASACMPPCVSRCD